MERIIIAHLYLTEKESFMDDLELTEKDIAIAIVFGGNVWGGFGLNPGLYITTIYDGVNTISKTHEGAGNFHDNKFNTIDYARTVNAWVNS